MMKVLIYKAFIFQNASQKSNPSLVFLNNKLKNIYFTEHLLVAASETRASIIYLR